MFQNSELVAEMDRLKKFAYKLTSSKYDAEDLLHSAMLRCMEKKHLFKEGTNLFSWSSKVMYNLFVSGYRRKVKFETQYDPESYIENKSVDPEQDIKADMNNIFDAMDQLSTDHRQILKLVCVDGMQYAEVSDMLDIPVGTVRSRLSRARENLSDTLGQTSMLPAARGFAKDHKNIAIAA